MWLIAIHRIRWIRLTDFQMKYISILTTSTTSPYIHILSIVRLGNACREKKKSFFFWSLYSFSIHFYSWTFVYCRPSLSRTYKIFMIRSKVLLLQLQLQLSHARSIWLESTWTIAIHTHLHWGNSVCLFISAAFLSFFIGDSRQVYFWTREFICYIDTPAQAIWLNAITFASVCFFSKWDFHSKTCVCVCDLCIWVELSWLDLKSLLVWKMEVVEKIPVIKACFLHLFTYRVSERERELMTSIMFCINNEWQCRVKSTVERTKQRKKRENKQSKWNWNMLIHSLKSSE